MTVLSRLMGTRTESRALLNDPKVPLTSASLVDWLNQGQRAHSGVVVTETSSLKMSAVFRAVNVLAGTGASLPLLTYATGTRNLKPCKLLDDPHPEMTPFEFWEFIYVSLTLWGNGYAQKIRNQLGQVVELWPIPPNSVKVGRVKPSEAIPSGKVFQVTDSKGVPHDLTSFDIFHVPGMGYDGVCGVSPIRMASQGIGLSLAEEEYGARLFGSGALMSGILQTEQRLDQDKAEALKKRWMDRIGGLSHAHEVAILDSGAKFQPIGINPDDAQFIEGRKFQLDEVARVFGVPPTLLFQTDGTSNWGTGIEQQSLGFVIYTLQASWLPRVEQRVTKELTPSAMFAQYNVDGLLRGDTAARYAAHAVARQWGLETLNQYNERENIPPVEGGDTYLIPINMTRIDAAGNVVGPPPDPSAPNPPATDTPIKVASDFEVESRREELQIQREQVDAWRAFAARSQPAPHVTVYAPPPAPAPSVTVRAAPTPNVTVEPAQVTVNVPAMSAATSRRIERDPDGNISRIVEEN